MSLADLLAKYDKSGDGMLNQQELTTLIRKDLKVRSRDVSDKEIASLVAALDDDGDGTLSIDELAGFVGGDDGGKALAIVETLDDVDARVALELVVDDWDQFSGNDFMGRLELPLAGYADKRRVRRWFKLQPQIGAKDSKLWGDEASKDRGEVELVLAAAIAPGRDVAEGSSSPPPPRHRSSSGCAGATARAWAACATRTATRRSSRTSS